MQTVHKIDLPPAGRWLIERLVTLSDDVEARQIARPEQRLAAAAVRGRASARKPRK
jgi:hypothetical protein